MAILTYVYLLAVLFFGNSMQAIYEGCGNGTPLPTNVKISGCESTPCSLKRGSNAEAFVDFNVVSNTKTLKPDVKVQVGGATTGYPLPEQNACKSLAKGQCPLEKGDSATYHMKMPVEKFYPKISLTIQVALVDEKQNTQACFRVPAKVVD